MRIIKKRRITEYLFTCPRCDCEFVMNAVECKDLSAWRGMMFVNCPCCTNQFTVDDDNMIIYSDGPLKSAWSRIVQLWGDLWKLT